MSHYSDDPEMVRVDFWRESGKWYATEAVKWAGPYTGGLLKTIFEDVLLHHLNGRMKGMWATCLEPYHEHSHPVSFRIPE